MERRLVCMKRKFYKVLATLLVLVICVNSNFVSLASSVEVSSVITEDRSTSSDFQIIEKEISDQYVHLEYYLERDGKRFLISESAYTLDNSIISNVETVEVDNKGDFIEPTRMFESNEYPIIENSNDDLFVGIALPQIQALGAKKWEPYSTTYSLMDAKLTVVSIAALLVAASGIGLSVATSVAAGMLAVYVGFGAGEIPKSIYFEGQRCVNRSVGKIYYRYRGNFYTDSSKSHLIKSNVSWSRRVGH